MRTNSMPILSQVTSKFPFLCLILVLVGISATISQAQGTSERGFMAGNSYALGSIENINMKNGNVMLNIPLASLPLGRGGLSGGVGLLYNSKLYVNTPQQVLDPHSPPDEPSYLNCNFLGAESGWQYGFGYGLMVYSRSTSEQCPAIEARYVHKVKMTFPDGSQHEFRPTGWLDQLQDGYFEIRPDGLSDSGCAMGAAGTLTYHTTDGSFLRLDVQHDSDQYWWNNPWTLYFPDGRRVTFNEPGTGGQRLYDRNGNYIEIRWIADYNGTGHEASQLVDQFNRSVTIEYNPTGGVDLIHYQGFGTSLTSTVKWKLITVRKQYVTTADGYNDGNWPWVDTLVQYLVVVDEIILPTQASSLKYIFGYNPGTSNPSYGWGEINSVTLPSGATANYTYTLSPGQKMSLNCGHSE